MRLNDQQMIVVAILLAGTLIALAVMASGPIRDRIAINDCARDAQELLGWPPEEARFNCRAEYGRR